MYRRYHCAAMSIRHTLWRTVPAVCFATGLGAAVQSTSPDWPGLWGPARDANVAAAVARPTGLKPLWRRAAAGGYSEVSARGSRLFTLELRDDADFVVAIDAGTGRDLWTLRIGETHRGHTGSHDGPIGTPAVGPDDVFAVGPHGMLVAADAGSGKERWRHDLVKEFGAERPVYGFGTSPLVEGPLVIVQTGGAKSRGLLAFDRATGRLAWSTGDGQHVGYSSPVAATLTGTRQILMAAGDRVTAVAPADGRLLWTAKGPGASEEVNNSPLVLPDDRVLLTFWNEAIMLKLSSAAGTISIAEVWRSPRLGRSQGPTIHRDGHLYGFSGAVMLCMDAATGDVKWRQRTYEGALVGYGANLVLLGRFSGELHVVRANPERYEELMRSSVLTPGATSITGPAVVGRRVYIRNVQEIAAFEFEG